MRLIKIDPLIRGDHPWLEAMDATECYCLGEYTARGGFQHGKINNLVYNIKKEVSRRGRPEYRYKDAAILETAALFSEVITPEYLSFATLIPIPPGDPKGHPGYDDRITRVLHQMGVGRNLDIRELLLQRETLRSHTENARPHPNEIYMNYSIDPALLTPPPRAIALFDDVVTAGAHFHAASRMLSEHCPGIEIAGFFIARRVFLQSDT